MADAIESAIRSSIEGLNSENVESPDVGVSVDDGDDSDTGDDGSTVVEGTTAGDDGSDGQPKVVKEPAVKAEKEEVIVDALAAELGLTRRTDGKLVDKNGKVVNAIPYPRVESITANSKKKAVEAVAEALGVDASTLKFDGLKTAIVEKLKTTGSVDAEELEHMRYVEGLMQERPDDYIKGLAKVFPSQFGKYLKVLEQAADGDKKDGDISDEVTEILSALPQPDLTYNDKGDKTYSVKGLQDAIVKAVVKGVALGEKRSKAAAESVVKPIQERETAAQQARAREAQFTNDINDAAENWEGFVEYHKDVLKAMEDDWNQAVIRDKRNPNTHVKFKNLHQAYIAVVPKKLREAGKVNEQEVRKKYDEELRKAPRSTSVEGEAVVDKKELTADDRIEAAIRRSIKHLKR